MLAPGTFGIQGIAISEIPTENNEGMELGAAGFDAPENVAFVVLGLLYGEGDFGKSLILANNCGEDTALHMCNVRRTFRYYEWCIETSKEMD